MNSFFSYQDLIYVKAFECDLSPLRQSLKCWEYFDQNKFVPNGTFTVVEMHGIEGMNLMSNYYPQDKIYSFY